jgi:hypothetical protein
MWKYAGELRVGDVWTERPQQRAARTYRVIAIEPGLAPTTMRMTGECVTTGQRRTMDFFLVNGSRFVPNGCNSPEDPARGTLRVIGEPCPAVARVPWWFTAIKVGVAAAILAWVIFG